MGFKIGNFPCKYLEMPFYKGTRNNKLWEDIITRWMERWVAIQCKQNHND